jgi:hypothetical protein
MWGALAERLPAPTPRRAAVLLPALDGGRESPHVPVLFHSALPARWRFLAGIAARPRNAEQRETTRETTMRTYLITYDATTAARHRLSGAIMQLGEAWARPLETTWYVQSAERAEALERRLTAHLEGEEGLLIQQVDQHAVLTNTALRWFRKRRPDAAETSNVVAFPGRLGEARAA